MQASVSTISGSIKTIQGFERAAILLPRGTKFQINDALYSPKSPKNLLSFKDIRHNGYHIETISEENDEYLQITSIIQGNKIILEKLFTLFFGLYYTRISTIEAHAIINQKFTDDFIIWHDRLGHLGSIMMQKIIGNSC
ncbi:retroelement pol polyprotein-like [Gossypium australe]|uniref:Retroelement pol polyprotein-like n=1 Tax=Gossypium australe TaxID=47621 RepID=A0A5B6W6P7_9ROSI|nr:retroelement pol polyprotein-like [Gossypium australe]